MRFCNGADTGLNVPRHESEPTSDWSFVARKFEELFERGKANDGNVKTIAGAPSASAKK